MRTHVVRASSLHTCPPAVYTRARATPGQAEAAVLLRLLEVHPAAAREVDENDMLPLHVATVHQPSSAVTRAL